MQEVKTMSDKSFDEIKKQERGYFLHPVGDGKFVYDPPTEADQDLNDVTREKIAAYAREHGGAWLGNVNLYKETIDKPIMVEYHDDMMVYNFQYHFVIPAYDAELERLIKERHETPYTGTAQDGELLDVIFARLDELGGETLNWV
jgi:hypothetical protein